MAIAACFVIVVAGMKAAASLLVPFLLSVFITIIVTPMFIGMRKRGVPAGVALLILILGLALIGFLGAGLVGKSVKGFTSDVPRYQTQLQQVNDKAIAWLAEHEVKDPEEIVGNVLDLKRVMGELGSFVNTLRGMLSNGFVILLVTSFMLMEVAALPRKVRSLPEVTDDTWSRLEQTVDTVRKYIGLKSIMSLVTAVLVFVLLLAFRVQYALLWALLAFALNFVPTVGSVIAASPAVLLALVQLGPGPAAGLGFGYIVTNIGISNIIEPRFMGRGLGLSPLIILLSLIFVGWVFGPVGMLLSAPLTMAVKISLESSDESRWMATLMGSPKKEARV